VDDTEQAEIYDAYVVEKKERLHAGKKQTVPYSTPQIMILGLISVLVWYEVIYLKVWAFLTGFSLLVLALGIVYIMNQRKTEEDREWIPEDVLKAIIKGKFKQKQLIGEIPPGKVIPELICRLGFIDGKTWKWQVRVKVRALSGLSKLYLVEAHPFTGEFLAIKEIPSGFTGTEPFDIKYILSRDAQFATKYPSLYGLKKPGTQK